MDNLTTVIALIAQILNKKAEDIKPNSKISEELGADELDHVEIVMELENLFNVSILDEDADKLITVGDLVSYIEKLLHPESGEGE